MKKILTALLMLAVSTSVVFGQNSIKVQAPNMVASDEQFNLTFVISGEDAPSDFQWNPGDDFQLVWGPQRGSSTSVSWVNGKHTKSSQTTYTYVLLPKKTGTFQLASATAKIKGQTVTSQPCSIEVVSNGTSSNQSSSSGTQPERSSSQTGTVSSEDIFLRFTVSKKSVVVGETLTATLKLYQRVNIAGFEDVRFPTFNGFWSQELQAPSNIEFQRENIGDNIYNAAVLRSWTLVPQQAGDLNIDSSELVCLVNVRSPRASSGSIFDSFFQDDYQTIRKRVSSSPVTIKVRPVPAGAPSSYGGGVGSFKMSAEMAKDSLKTHDASSLKITISGKGNVALLEAPKVNFPPDFEQYDVKTSEAAGSKTFEYPFIPRSRGDFVVGPIEYAYYDVNAGKYVTLTSPAMSVKVSGGNNDDVAATSSNQLIQSTLRKDVKDLGSDIRYISVRNTGLSEKGSSFAASSLFWLLTLLEVLAAAIVCIAVRMTRARRSDVAGNRGRSASKMARKRLSKAGEYLQSNLYTAFYEELHKALLGYVSDKLNMEASEMNKENIASSLVASNVDKQSADDFISLLDACEFARYSPDSGNEAMTAHFENAVSVISVIEGTMKKKKGRNSAIAAGLILLLSVPNVASAQDTDALWETAVEAYSLNDWQQAASSWKAIEAQGYESAELYCNIGDALYKQGDLAHAILYYERSLKMDPSYQDARYNLKYANSRIQDKIETVPVFFLKSWLRTLCRSLSADVWAILFLVFFCVFLAMVLLFVFARSIAAKKTGFIVGILVLLISLFVFSMSFWQHAENQNENSAIITAAVSSIKSSPSLDSATDLFVLHEGTKVRIVDTVGSWGNIELADGRRGWIQLSEMENI